MSPPTPAPIQARRTLATPVPIATRKTTRGAFYSIMKGKCASVLLDTPSTRHLETAFPLIRLGSPVLSSETAARTRSAKSLLKADCTQRRVSVMLPTAGRTTVTACAYGTGIFAPQTSSAPTRLLVASTPPASTKFVTRTKESVSAHPAATLTSMKPAVIRFLATARKTRTARCRAKFQALALDAPPTMAKFATLKRMFARFQVLLIYLTGARGPLPCSRIKKASLLRGC
mmetsp:Transcript_30246/g.64683  ORF Transcript_30246/g.64683 Transcript_30246/m.64683 type:complete len:230 (-) Transcript_30246:840-1529(-)